MTLDAEIVKEITTSNRDHSKDRKTYRSDIALVTYLVTSYLTNTLTKVNELGKWIRDFLIQ